MEGGALVSASRATYRLRASATARQITSEMRLVDLERGLTLNIRAAWLTEDRAWVDVMAEAGVPS